MGPGAQEAEGRRVTQAPVFRGLRGGPDVAAGSWMVLRRAVSPKL